MGAIAGDVVGQRADYDWYFAAAHAIDRAGIPADIRAVAEGVVRVGLAARNSGALHVGRSGGQTAEGIVQISVGADRFDVAGAVVLIQPGAPVRRIGRGTLLRGGG